MRRLMPVGLWALLLGWMVLAAPGRHVLGPTTAYAFDDTGSSYEQDSGNGGGGGAGASYGDPDGPQASPKSRTNPWYSWGGGGWHGAAVYGQVGVVSHHWTIRDLIVALRSYYLRF